VNKEFGKVVLTFWGGILYIKNDAKKAISKPRIKFFIILITLFLLKLRYNDCREQ